MLSSRSSLRPWPFIAASAEPDRPLSDPQASRPPGADRAAEPRAGDATAPTARLLIHAPVGFFPAERGVIDGAARWLQAWASGALRERARAATEVRIDDLHGRRHYACNGVRSLLDVPLPAGTYHITVRAAALQRRYTITLEAGAVFHLHLRVPVKLA